MKSIFTILTLLIGTHSFAQDIDGCDGQRYLDFVFESVDTTTAVSYGGGNLYPSEVYQELFYDVYEPSNDVLSNRPVMIFAFGGSFIEGERENISWLCNAFAQKGYVAVSIDYRLFDGPLFPPPNATQMKNVVMRAVSDMKGVIRHLKADADNTNTFGIDPDKIFIGGISAGSILACHTTALDSSDVFPADLQMIIEENGGLEGNTNDITGYDTDVYGLINYSGGLNEAVWFDEKHPPMFSVHDENDQVVPSGTGFATVFGFPIIQVEGSVVLHEKAVEFGVTNELVLFENSLAHVGYFLNEASTISVINRTAAFTNDLLCPSFSTSAEDIDIAVINLYPNPTAGQIAIDSEQEISSIQIYNSLGQILISTKSTRVDISNFESGYYNATIVTKDNKSVTKKIVKI